MFRFHGKPMLRMTANITFHVIQLYALLKKTYENLNQVQICTPIEACHFKFQHRNQSAKITRGQSKGCLVLNQFNNMSIAIKLRMVLKF